MVKNVKKISSTCILTGMYLNKNNRSIYTHTKSKEIVAIYSNDFEKELLQQFGEIYKYCFKLIKFKNDEPFLKQINYYKCTNKDIIFLPNMDKNLKVDLIFSKEGYFPSSPYISDKLLIISNQESSLSFMKFYNSEYTVGTLDEKYFQYTFSNPKWKVKVAANREELYAMLDQGKVDGIVEYESSYLINNLKEDGEKKYYVSSITLSKDTKTAYSTNIYLINNFSNYLSAKGILDFKYYYDKQGNLLIADEYININKTITFYDLNDKYGSYSTTYFNNFGMKKDLPENHQLY
ncbi:hypothetical protein CPAV1605_989 [seawater metagenome]|uniref:Uncharacterized protein n=1 Tax=seawater metagenome TaxID=1561972 RepID=A0A5E8CKM2_9ZZZZ